MEMLETPIRLPRFRFDLISVVPMYHEADIALPGMWRVNHDVHLIHILRGRGPLRFDAKHLRTAPGTAYLVPPMTAYAHGKDPGEPLEMVNFHFHLHLEGAPMTTRRTLPVYFDIPQPEQTTARLRQWAHQWTGGDTIARARVAGEAYRLILDYLEHLSSPVAPGGAMPHDPEMATIRQRIVASALGPYDGATLAREAHLSVSQLNRRFRAAHGESPRALYDRCRLARIQDRLQDADLPMQQIAEQFGFRDQFYFSRWFAQHCGASPTSFRRQSTG